MIVCDKTKYESYKKAQDAIGKIVGKTKKPMKVYKCNDCGGFHVATIHHNRKNMLPQKEKYEADYTLFKTPKKKMPPVNPEINRNGYGNPLSTYKPFEKLK